jgi:NAD+ synthase (glutamine-hydrolysing)
MEDFKLPAKLAKVQGSRTVPIGDAILEFNDTSMGIETCEELFTSNAPHIEQALAGAEIFSNASGSHHELRKLNQRLSLILEACKKAGGIYIYANQSGCDGDRLYYDGSSLITVNGDIVAQSSQFSLVDVEVATAVVDLDDVLSHRFAPSRGQQVNKCPDYPRVRVEHDLLGAKVGLNPDIMPSPTFSPQIHAPEEEIALGPAAWLWDYLRRSKQAGFLIPLSGGIDSCCTATIVFSMCRMVFNALSTGNEQVKSDVQRIASWGEEGWRPDSPQALCNRLLHTVYLGMSEQSSQETRSRAKRLAEAIGAFHQEVDIDDVYHAQKS